MQMAPFGPENHKPMFEAANVYAKNSLTGFKEKHIRFLAAQHDNDSVFNVIGFDLMQHYERIASGDSFNMAFTIEENTYNGNTSIQLRIKDIQF
jgi:single-stranded-DNA-specific exonuclease